MEKRRGPVSHRWTSWIWIAAYLTLALCMCDRSYANDAIDACALVPLADMAPLVAQGADYDVRTRSVYPAQGESVCHWEAFRKGLTADAPPEYGVFATVYHFANAQHAAMEFNKAWQGMIASSLVRTADPTDQLAREDGDAIGVRHGADVVRLDPSGQQGALQREPDRFYRLETMAFRLAGAEVQGAVDPKAIQAPCSWLPAQHALGVLTTDPSSLQISSDGWRCTMDVKDGLPDTDHWTQNHGEVQIQRRDMGTNAAALQFQQHQTPFLPASTLVKTADATDRLVWDSQHPEEAWAVHGPFYVEFELTNVTPAAKAAPGWLYRTQRLALEAAGAVIVPTEGLPADPVVPGPLPSRSEGTSANTDLQWMPPPHNVPPGSDLYDPLLRVVVFAAENRFFLLFAFIFLPGFLSGVLPGKRKAGRTAGLVTLSIVLGLVNLIFGPDIADTLVYHAGAAGSGVITASHATATQYNNHNVRGFTVLIRTADGKVVESGFDDDDFNVYPPHNETIYPREGDVFTVRYLTHAPRTFVIVSGDDSPWAHDLRCAKLGMVVSDATAKRDFAPDNAGYKEAFTRAIAAASQAGCETD